jgi:glycosyltransferase involved in cell wall biosynthesis
MPRAERNGRLVAGESSVLHVALATDALYPYHVGGKEVRLREELARVPSDTLRYRVYSMKWWDEAPDGTTVSYRAICRLHPLYVKGRRSIRQAATFSLSCLKLLFERFDVLEGDQMPFLPLPPLWVVATLKRRPLLVTWYEVWGREYWRNYLGPLGIIGYVVERVATMLPTRIISISPGTTAKLKAMGVAEHKIVTIACGVDRQRLEGVVAREGAHELICVGRLLSHKRVDVAIEALAALVRGGYDVRLSVVGEGPERAALEALARSLDVAHRVTFHDFFDDGDEAWGYIKGSRVMVFPSEREDSGLVAAEAMALGTPVVTSDAPDNLAQHLVTASVTGDLFKAGDATALAEALKPWLDGPSRSVSEDFLALHPDVDWAVAARTHEELVRSLARQ